MLDDERSSKRFLTLENSKAYFNNNVSHLKVVDEIIDNTTTTDPKKILQEFTKQFQAIYGLQPDVNGTEENITSFNFNFVKTQFTFA